MSELTLLRKSQNPALRDAIHQAVPALAQHEKTLDELQALARDSFKGAGEHDPATDVLAALRRQVEAGEPLADLDLDELAAAATMRGTSRQAAARAIERMLMEVDNEADNTLRWGADRVLTHLDRQVKDIVRSARALDLRGADSAESAIRADVVEAWRSLTATLQPQYVRIRQAQALVCQYLWPGGKHSAGKDVGTFGFIQNYADIDPGWRRRLLGTNHHSRPPATGISPFGAGPRQTLDPRQVLSPIPDGHEDRFLWLTHTPNAVPWVPTDRQAQQAKSAATEADLADAAPPATITGHELDDELASAELRTDKLGLDDSPIY